jgi:hypothetical protein
MHGRQGRYREIRGVFLDLEAVVAMELLEETSGKYMLRIAMVGGTLLRFAPRPSDPDDYAKHLYEELIYQVAEFASVGLEGPLELRLARARDAAKNEAAS